MIEISPFIIGKDKCKNVNKLGVCGNNVYQKFKQR